MDISPADKDQATPRCSSMGRLCDWARSEAFWSRLQVHACTVALRAGESAGVMAWSWSVLFQRVCVPWSYRAPHVCNVMLLWLCMNIPKETFHTLTHSTHMIALTHSHTHDCTYTLTHSTHMIALTHSLTHTRDMCMRICCFA